MNSPPFPPCLRYETSVVWRATEASLRAAMGVGFPPAAVADHDPEMDPDGPPGPPQSAFGPSDPVDDISVRS